MHKSDSPFLGISSSPIWALKNSLGAHTAAWCDRKNLSPVSPQFHVLSRLFNRASAELPQAHQHQGFNHVIDCRTALCRDGADFSVNPR